MPNPYFQFKQFTVHHDQCSMKVTTDSCLFGAWVAQDIALSSDKIHALDIGSGSGLLSLMIAQESHCIIEGIEIQTSDYLQSIENIDNSPFKNRIHIHHDDATTFAYSKQYDIIVSNPPFYQNQLKSTDITKNKAHHDDTLTLNRLFQIIKKRLLPNGNFYILLPENRLDDCRQLVDSIQLFINKICWVHQTESHNAFRVMLRGSTHSDTQPEEKILIKEKGVYSQRFVQLLNKYYLHL